MMINFLFLNRESTGYCHFANIMNKTIGKQTYETSELALL